MYSFFSSVLFVHNGNKIRIFVSVYLNDYRVVGSCCHYVFLNVIHWKRLVCLIWFLHHRKWSFCSSASVLLWDRQLTWMTPAGLTFESYHSIFVSSSLGLFVSFFCLSYRLFHFLFFGLESWSESLSEVWDLESRKE